ncbi:unnamed protein product [Amoebophrya sp. A25]|nr:unnamed protein product [Amoebophrya sp. A25]|eukprot:GSA25T00026499001.1
METDCAVSCQAPAPPDETSAFKLERSSCYVALAEQNDGNCKCRSKDEETGHLETVLVCKKKCVFPRLWLIERKSLRSPPTHARRLASHRAHTWSVLSSSGETHLRSLNYSMQEISCACTSRSATCEVLRIPLGVTKSDDDPDFSNVRTGVRF